MNENTFGAVALVALVAAIWYDSRSKRTATTASGAPAQSYSTPTSIGEQAARFVNALTLGILSAKPKGVTPENAQDAFRRAEIQAQNTASGWSGPTQSQVSVDSSAWGTSNDSNLSAPVYNRSEDLVQNPFLLAAL
jgi:hypothetical protein